MVNAPRSKAKKTRNTMDIRGFFSDNSRSTSPQLPGNLPAAAAALFMAAQPQQHPGPLPEGMVIAETPGAVGPCPAPALPAGGPLVDLVAGKEEPCKESCAAVTGSVPDGSSAVEIALPFPAGGPPEAMDVVAGCEPAGVEHDAVAASVPGVAGVEGVPMPPAMPPPAPVGVMPDHLAIDLPPLVMRPDTPTIPAPGLDAPPAPLPPSMEMPPDMKMPTEEQLRKMAAQLPAGPDGQPAGGQLRIPGSAPGQLNERHGLPSNLSKEIREMLLSGGPTPHMVTVGPTGKDEIVLGGTDRRTQGRAYQTKKRIERLESLSRCPRSDLNAHEKEAKLRLLKLESNRRAAQVSRQKKKRYIANLEERAAMMAKHLAALDIENGQLRALLAEVAAKVIPGGNLTNGITLPGGGVLEFPMPAPQLPLPPLAFAPKTEPSTPSARVRSSSTSVTGSESSSLRNSQKRTLNEMFAS